MGTFFGKILKSKNYWQEMDLYKENEGLTIDKIFLMNYVLLFVNLKYVVGILENIKLN